MRSMFDRFAFLLPTSFSDGNLPFAVAICCRVQNLVCAANEYLRPFRVFRLFRGCHPFLTRRSVRCRCCNHQIREIDERNHGQARSNLPHDDAVAKLCTAVRARLLIPCYKTPTNHDMDTEDAAALQQVVARPRAPGHVGRYAGQHTSGVI